MMDASDVLRIIADLSSGSLRSSREQQKQMREHRAIREALRQTTTDLEEMAKLVNILYETLQRMGDVIDYFLKERGDETGQEAQSFGLMLSAVLHQMESQESEHGPENNHLEHGPQVATDKNAPTSAGSSEHTGE